VTRHLLLYYSLLDNYTLANKDIATHPSAIAKNSQRKTEDTVMNDPSERLHFLRFSIHKYILRRSAIIIESGSSSTRESSEWMCASPPRVKRPKQITHRRAIRGPQVEISRRSVSLIIRTHYQHRPAADANSFCRTSLRWVMMTPAAVFAHSSATCAQSRANSGVTLPIL
jgi:hypothetical protein